MKKVEWGAPFNKPDKRKLAGLMVKRRMHMHIHIKKLICLALCLCMILSAMTVLAGCRKRYTFSPKDGELSTSEEIVELDLTDYVMTYDKSMSATARQEAANLISDLRSLSNVSISIREDMEKEVVDNESLEILIGNTKRTETAEALDYVKNHGWAICVIDTKLVITGTTAMLTRFALKHLVENYLSSENVSGTVWRIPSTIVYSDMEVTTLFDDRSVSYNVVYDDQYDDVDDVALDSSYRYDSDRDPDGGKGTDEIYDFSVDFTATFSTASGLTQSTLKLTTDDQAATEHEVLVGNMDRADVKAQLADLAANEYGIAIDGKRIYLLAWNAVALKYTSDMFTEVIGDCTLIDAVGNKSYIAPKSLSLKKTINKNTWAVDFPKPEGENILLDGTLDVGNDCVEYIYSGSGINATAFATYCRKLENAGYKLLAGSVNQVGNDLFRNYVNETEKTALYVYLSNYQYATQYHVTDVLPSIRIISSATDGETDLPTADMMDPTAYNNRTYTAIPGKNAKITQMTHKYNVSNNFGNCYFYTLADGSFVVYDGGAGKADEAANLYNAMKNMYREMHGVEPDGDQNRMHIRAWWLSHEHMDHHTVVTIFLENYGKQIDFDAMLCNFVSSSERYNSENPGIIPKNITKLRSYVTGGFDFIKLHTGQTFYFNNLKFEVLYTHEDTYPKGLEYFNNSSTVVRCTLKASSGAESTFLWLGDVERIGGRRLLATYGTSLKSDMVQVAHHGWNGITKEMYDVISPEVVWWPQSKNNVINWSKNKTHANWFYEVDHYIAYDLASVKLLLIADVYNTTMDITGTAADYDHLTDALNPETTIVSCKGMPTNLNNSTLTSTVIDKRT